MNKNLHGYFRSPPNENTILARSTWKVIPTGNKVDTKQKWRRELGFGGGIPIPRHGKH